MQRNLIHACNYLWLIVVLLGVASITGVQFGGLNVSATSKSQTLLLGGLGMGVAINFLAGWWLGGKLRKTCWKWVMCQGSILLTYYLVFTGHVRFRWLKDSLLWLKDSVHGM